MKTIVYTGTLLLLVSPLFAQNETRYLEPVISTELVNSGTFSFTGGENDTDEYKHVWNFGDGTQSIDRVPVHTYDQHGIYEVEHSMTNKVTGEVNTVTSSVHVGYLVDVKADFIQMENEQGMNQFLDLSEGPKLTYHWDFGDGNTSISPIPNHTYRFSGEYNVCLTVTDARGKVSSTCKTISVKNGIADLVEFTGKIFPNPVSEIATIEVHSSTKETVSVTVVSVDGRIQISQTVDLKEGMNRFLIDASSLVSGAYFVRIQGEQVSGKLSFIRK